MRKRLITPPIAQSIRTRRERWLDVERAAVVEVTSEDGNYPVETALSQEMGRVGVPQPRGAKRFD